MDEQIAIKLDNFFKQFKRVKYKKGEILIRADDAPPGIFYLKEGIIKKYAISNKGDELIVNIFRPISFFPMSWAINNSPNAYYYEAVTEVDVWRAQREKVVDFIKREPDVLYDLMSRVYIGTEGMFMRMTYLMTGNAYARVVTELLIHAKRFGIKEKGQAKVKISERDLAAQSGMTRETVSREIKLLKDKGLVTLKNHFMIIKDLVELEKELTIDL